MPSTHVHLRLDIELAPSSLTLLCGELHCVKVTFSWHSARNYTCDAVHSIEQSICGKFSPSPI